MNQLATKLEEENFHASDWVKSSRDNIKELWTKLLELLSKRSSRLHKHLELHQIFQEMVYIIDWMDDVKVTSLKPFTSYKEYPCICC